MSSQEQNELLNVEKQQEKEVQCYPRLTCTVALKSKSHQHIIRHKNILKITSENNNKNKNAKLHFKKQEKFQKSKRKTEKYFVKENKIP